MASRTLTVTLDAKDNLSAAFRKAGDSSSTLGETLGKIGPEGKRAFDMLEQGASTVTVSMKTLERQAGSFGDRLQGAGQTLDDFGEGLTVMGAGLVYAGQQAMNQERQIIALRAAYGDAADEMLAFAEELDKVTIFSDDDIREGERFFATLRNNYGLTTAEIQKLMQTTADLASATNISFADASERVTAAIRGEAEAAEYLGLTLNQQAIDRNNLTLTMTNEEAARYRLNALYDQAAVYQGTAQEVAQSSIGTYAELTDTIQDNAAAVGDFIGPWGSMITGFGSAAIGISGTVGAFGKLGGVMRTSTAATTALSLAMNPAVLGLSALTAAGVVWYQTLDEGESAWDRFDAAMTRLVEADTEGWFESIGDAIKIFISGAEEATVETAGLTEQLKELQSVALSTGNQQLAIFEDQARGAANYADRAAEGSQVIQDGLTAEEVARANAIETGRDYQTVLKEINEEYSLGQSESAPYIEAQSKISAALQDQSTDVQKLNKDTTGLYNLLLTGVITYDQYASSIVGVADNLDQYQKAQTEAIESTGTFTASLTGVASGAEALLSIFGDLATGIPTTTEQIESMAESTKKLTASVTEGADALASVFGGGSVYRDSAEAQITALGEVSQAEQDAADERKAAVEDLIGEITTLQDEMVANFHQGMQDWLSDGANILSFLDEFAVKSRAGTEWARQFSQEFSAGLNTDQLNQSFDQVLRTFDEIDQLASRPSKAGSIAENLVGTPGEWAAIDDLLNAGRISLEQYNDTVWAGYAIQENASLAQMTLNEIRADQLPLLEQEQAAYAKNLKALSELNPLEQRRALLLQDTAVQSQVASLYSEAYAASVGEIPEEVATQMILQSAEADAGLKDLLLQFGLIEEMPDGELRVNFPDGDAVTRSIDSLTDSVDALIVTMGGIPPLHVEADTGQATAAVQDVITVLTGIEGTSATVALLGDGTDALSVVASVEAARDTVDGTSALVSVLGDNADAMTAMYTALGELQGIDGSAASFYVHGDNSDALAAIYEIGAYAGASLGTAYFTVQTNHVDAYSSIGNVFGGYQQHGGLLHYASGGLVPFIGAEGNRPEVAHFANGGTAILPMEGLYAAPPMTVISPANATPDAGRGGDVHVHVHGPVFGMDDLVTQVWEAGAPALAEELRRHFRAHGAQS